MCIICLEYQKNKLTLKEARHNFGEMALNIDIEHRQEVEDMLSTEEEIERMEAEYYDPFDTPYDDPFYDLHWGVGSD